MTLAQFAIAVGADPKWVQNVATILERSFRYDQSEALWLGLVKALHDELGVTLVRADRMASKLLAADQVVGDDGASVKAGELFDVRLDLSRYLSNFAVRLARAREHGQPRMRGRRRRRSGDAIERAREHGIDIGLLDRSLAMTAAERLRRLNEDVEFVRDLHRSARR